MRKLIDWIRIQYKLWQLRKEDPFIYEEED